MESNRLQSHWPYIERKLTMQYPQVAPDLWGQTAGCHDAIVRLIRDTYAPGRSELSVEAEVRDLLNGWIAQIEAVE